MRAELESRRFGARCVAAFSWYCNLYLRKPTCRVPDEISKAVDEWAVCHDTTRSEAIRRLVELGLTVKAKARPRAQHQKDRAKELAGKTIDKVTDVGATDEVKLDRKRRLIKVHFKSIRSGRSSLIAKSYLRFRSTRALRILPNLLQKRRGLAIDPQEIKIDAAITGFR